jgi:hypothetical protein
LLSDQKKWNAGKCEDVPSRDLMAYMAVQYAKASTKCLYRRLLRNKQGSFKANVDLSTHSI